MTSRAARFVVPWMLVSGLVVPLAGCVRGERSAIRELLFQPVTAEQHEAIAARYRRQAAEARELAATHVTMAARYRAWDAGRTPGQSGERMEEHCRALAADYDDAANRYEALAASHEALARDGRETPRRERPQDRRR